ncbi:oocyte zinc finger protein XlCOF19-like [Dunckerocampus dactyliophorus]|uniref:oocyte zinc finger protein XlCOF19-like n=1 Tax=Dunckerocampus dactyliophorus TaxID=161453 RepID=UPI00240535BE|nr:oocyte zinc finger protein XlCOF19-like [Dunckerocampus dactyliophorus]
MLNIEKVIVGTSNVRKATTESRESLDTPDCDTAVECDSLYCSRCLITFTTFKTKTNHIRRVHRDLYSKLLMKDNTVFGCYKCDRCFASPEELSVHHATHRVDEVPVCSSCKTVFPSFTELHKHKRGCHEGGWHCRDCGSMVPCASLLEFHAHCIAMHDKDVTEGGAHRCTICLHGFRTLDALLNHQERVTKADVKPARKRGPEANTREDSKKVKKTEERKAPAPELKIPCSEDNCDLVFPSVDALRMHKKSQHGPPLSSQKPCKKR